MDFPQSFPHAAACLACSPTWPGPCWAPSPVLIFSLLCSLILSEATCQPAPREVLPPQIQAPLSSLFASPPGASGYVFTEPERTFLLSQETVSWSRLGGPQTHIPSTGPRQLQRITSGIPLKCSFSAPATDLQRIR